MVEQVKSCIYSTAVQSTGAPAGYLDLALDDAAPAL
jgi:hypothetical protein